MSMQLPHPAVLVSLGQDRDDVTLAEAELVILRPLEVYQGPGPLLVGIATGREDLQVLVMALEAVVGLHTSSLIHGVQALEEGPDPQNGFP